MSINGINTLVSHKICDLLNDKLSFNLEFSSWRNIFIDKQIVAAMIYRLVHHGYLNVFGGQTTRLRMLIGQYPFISREGAMS